MNYFAGHMKKLHVSDLKWSQMHNQRERESRSNRDIDKSKSLLNYDLANEQKINYEEKINNRIKEGLKPRARVRKDSVRVNSWVITSNKEFFDRIGEQEEKRFFKEGYKWFCDRYGKENIAFAMVHKDEHTPHMHLGVIPITKDGRLSSKELFNRQRLKEIQGQFPKFIQSRGFDLKRGIPSKQKHMEPVKYKNKQLLKEKEQLEQKALKLKALLNKGIKFVSDLKKEKQQLEHQLKPLKEINKTVSELSRMSAESVLLNRHQVKVQRDDWETLQKQASKARYLQNENERLQQQNGLLFKRVNEFRFEMQEMREQVDAFLDLSERHQDLKDYTKTLESKLGIVEKDLKQEFELDLEIDREIKNTIDLGDDL